MSANIYSYRGGVIDNRHTASLAVVTPSGKLLAYAGDPGLQAHLRSSSKPFQAQAIFQTNAVGHFGLTPKEIAVSCASHSGSPDHVATVGGYLQKIGLNQDYLACGAHMPSDADSVRILTETHQKPMFLHSNCSGKHTGMLAAAMTMGATPRGYEQPDHPVQQMNFQTVRDLADVDHVPYGIDGCSVPAFILPLVNAARMFALLAAPDAAPSKYQSGLHTTYTSMRAHPDMVSGNDGMDTVLMRALPDFACKGGADGYHGLALRNTRWGPLGVTMKVESGSYEAHNPLVVALLEQLGVLSPDLALPWRRPLLRNVRGLEVGHWETELKLDWT